MCGRECVIHSTHWGSTPVLVLSGCQGCFGWSRVSLRLIGSFYCLLPFKISSHVAAWMGGECRGERIYVYVWLSPFAVHLKLSQHC